MYSNTVKINIGKKKRWILLTKQLHQLILSLFTSWMNRVCAIQDYTLTFGGCFFYLDKTSIKLWGLTEYISVQVRCPLPNFAVAPLGCRQARLHKTKEHVKTFLERSQIAPPNSILVSLFTFVFHSKPLPENGFICKNVVSFTISTKKKYAL